MKKQIIQLLQKRSHFLINKTNLNSDLYYIPSYTYTNSTPDDYDVVLEYMGLSKSDFLGSTPEQISDFFAEDKSKLVGLIENSDPMLTNSLHNLGDYYLQSIHDNTVLLRGIIEFSNICEKNCYYCGIRKDNENVNRYYIDDDEIIDLAIDCYDARYGTLMLQSGELKSQKTIDRLSSVIEKICEKTNDELCIALSVGELSHDQYKQLYDAGAQRYLLRIESTNKDIYHTIHPDDHSWEERDRCIDDLLSIGYYTGTGVLINLPGQTTDDLIDDLLYFKNKNIDMIGMGPYIIDEDTPLANEWLKENAKDDELYNLKLLYLCLNMLSVARILNPYSNISATTALQLLDPDARKLGLSCGCNVVMPILTPSDYRKEYRLYKRKELVDNVKQRDALFDSVKEMGKTLNIDGSWGHPKTK